MHEVQSFGKSAKLHSRNSLKMYSSQSENAIYTNKYNVTQLFITSYNRFMVVNKTYDTVEKAKIKSNIIILLNDIIKQI